MSMSPLPKSSTSLIPLPKDLPDFLAPFIPTLLDCKPFITLTYAQSLDSRIAAKPGERTTISHLETKTMTHYLRSHHDGILIGSGTVLADDPGLNCRFKENGNEHTPRPIIVDPLFRWDYKGSKLQELVMKGESLEPWIIIAKGVEDKVQSKIDFLEKIGGKVISLELDSDRKLKWDDVFLELKKNGIDSVMVEGGAKIINQLLTSKGLVDSLIITVGPCFLGDQGVEVSPPQSVQLRNVHWWKGVQDTVMCANLVD